MTNSTFRCLALACLVWTAPGCNRQVEAEAQKVTSLSTVEPSRSPGSERQTPPSKGSTVKKAVNDNNPPPTGDKKSDEVLAALLVKGNNAFALDLHRQLAEKSQPNGNLFFSPYSISSTLCLAYSAARGSTANQMAKGLQLNLTPENVPAAFRAWQLGNGKKATAEPDSGYQLTTASSLWGQKGLGIRPDFIEKAKAGFGAEVQEIGFKEDPEKARQTINTWIKQQTQGKFPELLAPGSVLAGTDIVLASAIYFKAAWASPFKKSATEEGLFHVRPEKNVTVSFMKQTVPFAYFKANVCQVLELPYKGGDLTMLVLLPDRKSSLPDLERALTPLALNDWLAHLEKREVQVWLPRFQMTYDCELREGLSSLGMKQAFSPEADFSGMTGGKEFHLSSVLHKAFVIVNEEGTEAGAATVAKVVERGMQDIPIFKADRPFIFLLRDTRSGGIIFMGRLVNPT